MIKIYFMTVKKYSHLRHNWFSACCFLRKFPMHWCHSLILRHASKTHISTANHLLWFLLIVVSFLTYLVILTPDKTVLTFPAITNISFMSMIKVKTWTRFMVLFTSGSLLTWGISKWPCLVSLPAICLLLTPNNYIPWSFTDITLWLNMHSLLRRQTYGGRTWLLVGGL